MLLEWESACTAVTLIAASVVCGGCVEYAKPLWQGCIEPARRKIATTGFDRYDSGLHVL
jgi:hypothetical protein